MNTLHGGVGLETIWTKLIIIKSIILIHRDIKSLLHEKRGKTMEKDIELYNVLDIISKGELKLNYPVTKAAAINHLNIPSKGIYLWFANSCQLKDLQISPNDKLLSIHESQETLFLIYIGIAPENEDSNHTLKQRVTQNHIIGNIGASTFRYSLASLLKLQFFRKSKGKTNSYFIKDEETLSDFIKKLNIIFCAHNSPWEIEREMINKIEPPINIEHNKLGWFCKKIKAARKVSRENSKLEY